MQISGVFSGSFFKSRPFSDIHPPSSRQSVGKHGNESVINLEELVNGSKHEALKGRVVGIVKQSDLNPCLQANGNFKIDKTLIDFFDKPRGIKNLPKGFETQYLLPFGTGVALSEDLILTAGHNCRSAPNNIRVVQYDLDGVNLSKSRVYEIEDYIHRQDFFDENEADPETYANNLLKGEWTIIKLKSPLKDVKGALKAASNANGYLKGLKTFTLGHPYGLPLKKTNGEIDNKLNDQIVRYEAETLPGMSGGPVFSDASNELIGLHIRGNINYKYDSTGAIIFTVTIPDNDKLIEMGVYGTFFQNIVPVIAKIARPTLAYIPSSASSPSPKELKESDEAKEREFERFKQRKNELEIKPNRQEPLKIETERKEMETFMIAFGKKSWANHFGDVGLEPPLPANIQAILNSPCPIWSGKKVGETHMLTLIPAKVNGQPLTINSLGKLVKNDFRGVDEYASSKGTGYHYIDDQIVKRVGDLPIEKSYWVLMTRAVLPESQNKSYGHQKGMVEKLGLEDKSYKIWTLMRGANLDDKQDKKNYYGLVMKSKLGYQVPKIIEAAVSILMNYYRTGKNERLFDNNTTRCQDWAGDLTVVGNFNPSGLSTFTNSLDYDLFGVAALWKIE